ncbi:hypothetical protein, partial [Klebsiella pneumoniae]|uniref:hypothetical protein n=1 Tax=Klebsiella pneumoniae TaxID=573 RepID=UPI0014025792
PAAPRRRGWHRPTGSVSVVWGERSGQRCRLAYAIRDDAVQQVSSGTPHQVCRPGIKEK